MTRQQEARLDTMLGDEEGDPEVRAGLMAVSRVLRAFGTTDGLSKPPGAPVPVTAPK